MSGKKVVWRSPGICLLVVLLVLLAGCLAAPGPLEDPVAGEEGSPEHADPREDRDAVAEAEAEEGLEVKEGEKGQDEEEEIRPAPEVFLASQTPLPGDHLRVEIRNLESLPPLRLETELEGSFSQPFWREDRVCLLWGISYANEPGSYSLTLEIPGVDGGASREMRQEIQLLAGDFPYQEFSVSPQRTEGWEAEQLRQDREKVRRARENPAPEQLWDGSFQWPLEGRISSDFGAVRVINQGEPRRHSGIDIVAPAGTELVAANSGLVRLAEHLLASGNIVIVDHGLGLFSAYLHMEEIQVREGQRVEKGEVLGTVGETGYVTGPHLHWSVYIGHTPVSPYGFLEDDPRAGETP